MTKARQRGKGDAPTDTQPRTVSVAVLNDYEIVVRGVAAMLALFDDRVRVIEMAVEGAPSTPADVALFDSFAGRRHTLARAAEMVDTGRARHVVLYTWDAAPDFVRAAEQIGVSGVVLKTRSARALVESIERVAAGEKVGFSGLTPESTRLASELSDRESEVLAPLARGLTNSRIAEELYLSVETVKTYVKRLYAKLDVHNRTQAAIAASDHQLLPRAQIAAN